MDIFVGSLSFKLKESELREAFEKFGEVTSAKIIIDKITRQSKGFGFVEMPDEEQARLAISQLNGAEMYGRPLVVNESQKKESRPPRTDGGFSPRPNTSSGDRYVKKPENTGGGDVYKDTRSTEKPSNDSPPKSSGGFNKGGYGDSFGGGKSRDFGRDKGPHKGGESKKGGGGSKKADFRKSRDDDDDDWY